MKMLITGGHGFLGSTLVPMLHEKYGAEHILCPSIEDLNLLDEKSVSDYLSLHQLDCIVHLAAKMSGIGELMAHPREYLEDNLILNYNIVKHAIENRVSKFITLGSSCGYNDNTPLPMKESSFWQLKPENTYGLCKLLMLEHLQSQSEMNWVYLVPANLYGPYDHFGDINAHLIPATILKFERAVQNGDNFIDVWGDGSQERDFMYVEDAARLIIQSIDDARFYRKVVNLSTNSGITVKDIVSHIRSLMSLDHIEIRLDPTKPTGIKRKVLSNDLLNDLVPGFIYTGIYDGLKKSINYHRQNP